MAKTGIKATDEAIKVFNEIKTHTFDWACFEISGNGKDQVVECTKKFPDDEEGKNAMKEDAKNDEANFKDRAYAHLQSTFEENVPRFAVVDFRCKTKDGRNISALVFITFIPDSCKVRQRMLYAGSSDAVKQQMDCKIKIQASARDEIDYQSILETVLSKSS